MDVSSKRGHTLNSALPSMNGQLLHELQDHFLQK
jgi:hypothetical protein